MFNNNKFADYLKSHDEYHQAQTAKFVKNLKDFQSFLEKRGVKSEHDITKKDINDYVAEKNAQGEDAYHYIETIIEYFISVKNGVLSHEAWLLYDAVGHFGKISELTKNELGEDAWRQVFGNTELPKFGWTLDEITDFTRQMHKRVSAVAPREHVENMIQLHAHGVEQHFDGTIHEILESRGVDGLIKHLNDEFIKEVESCRDKGIFYSGSMVDDDVINFYKENPLNRRVGNKIINKQPPSLAKEYLVETDEKLKRYNACHCAIKKHSILQNDGGLSHSLCYCCFGHSKKQFEAAFGRELSGRVVKTVMDDGCLECVFEIDIPEGVAGKNCSACNAPCNR